MSVERIDLAFPTYLRTKYPHWPIESQQKGFVWTCVPFCTLQRRSIPSSKFQTTSLDLDTTQRSFWFRNRSKDRSKLKAFYFLTPSPCFAPATMRPTDCLRPSGCVARSRNVRDPRLWGACFGRSTLIICSFIIQVRPFRRQKRVRQLCETL